MLIVGLVVFSLLAATACGYALGVSVAARRVRDFAAAVEALDYAAPTARVDSEAVPAVLRPVVTRINQLIAARRLADLAARDAAARARAGDGRSEQIARELEPAIAAVRDRAAAWRKRVPDPIVGAGLDDIVAELARLDHLLGGVIAVAQAAERPEARTDLCAAVRAAVRSTTATRSVSLTLDLDENPCPIPGTSDAVERLATAFLQHAVAAGGTKPVVGVYVRRIPRVQLEEPTVRRQTDPGLTIIPRRANPRLERWLREGNPPAEVVKFIVADSGDGIPADIEKRLYDPAVGGGIGLTTARRVIEQARGTVWVQRAREGGAALHVVLPVARDAAEVADERNQMLLRAVS
ncbi:MAG: hypothetical protein SFW08_00410 [Gemmatimonadaceae bacterium]|nr:hypothetical protein [Gemmatimonadaceae bacterium]